MLFAVFPVFSSTSIAAGRPLIDHEHLPDPPDRPAKGKGKGDKGDKGDDKGDRHLGSRAIAFLDELGPLGIQGIAVIQAGRGGEKI